MGNLFSSSKVVPSSCQRQHVSPVKVAHNRLSKKISNRVSPLANSSCFSEAEAQLKEDERFYKQLLRAHAYKHTVTCGCLLSNAYVDEEKKEDEVVNSDVMVVSSGSDSTATFDPEVVITRQEILVTFECFDFSKYSNAMMKDMMWTHNYFLFQYSNLVSQYALTPHNFSNACVVISCVTIQSFFNGYFTQEKVFTIYKDLISYGNTLYFDIPGVAEQAINLFVEEAIVDCNLPIIAKPDIGCWFLKEIVENITTAHIERDADEDRSAFVLIVPPDKAMAILMEKDEIMILDSHGHKNGENGALLLAGKLQDALDLFLKLEEVLDTSLMGCDLTQICMQ